MKQSDIHVGVVYCGKTGREREVVELYADKWGEPCVRYRYAGTLDRSAMYLRSFARWAERAMYATNSEAAKVFAA